MWLMIILLQSFFIALAVGEVSTGAIQLKNGHLRGSLVDVNSDATRKVYLYSAIPYGKANRFEKAKAAPAWNGIFNATEEGYACPQKLSVRSALVQSAKMDEENCLVLNVWRPASWKAFRAVIFYIHPGGFTAGSIFALINDAKHFVDRGDVVVVAPNFRLGPLGFSYFGKEKTGSENLGLHDLMLALQWVKENIGEFSGDPNFITVLGSSSGSVVAGAFILSPLTAGLYKKAILLSGSPNSVFGVASKELALRRTNQLASDVGCSSSNGESIEQCLKKKSAIELVQTLQDEPSMNISFFSPLYGDDFLPISPNEALKSGNFNHGIDLLFGSNLVEGGLAIVAMNPELMNASANLSTERAKEMLTFVFKKVALDFGYKIKVDDVIKQYIDSLNNPTSDELKITISKAFGDFAISCPLLLFAQSMARHDPKSHYFYYRLAQRSLMADVLNLPNWIGPPHGEDLMYLFNYPEKKRKVDKQFREDFTRAVIAFIKTGNVGKIGDTLWEEAFQDNKDAASGEGQSRYMKLNVSDYKMAIAEKICSTFWKDRIEL